MKVNMQLTSSRQLSLVILSALLLVCALLMSQPIACKSSASRALYVSQYFGGRYWEFTMPEVQCEKP